MSDYSVIYKYQIEVGKIIEIPWRDIEPKPSVVTHVAVRPDPAVVDVWVLHPFGPDIFSDMAKFEVVGTGQPFPTNTQVVGTTVHQLTGLVCHVVRYL